MRASRVGAVFLFCIAASYASASEIETLFPDGGLRYKSCQINLVPQTDGYAINIKQDCPSGYCYDHRQEGRFIEVNAKQTEVFGKTLTNYHKIDRNKKTTTLEVKEYGELEADKSIGIITGTLGGSESVLIGYGQATLKIRIDNETGQVEEFQAYGKAKVNWFAAIRGGILTTLRGFHAIGRKVNVIDCESPAQEMRKTLVYLLEEEVPLYEDRVLTDAERMALDAKLLDDLPNAGKEEYVDGEYFNNTPLHFAARHGLERFARRLIEVLPKEVTDQYHRQINPINFQNQDEDTPLHLAVRRGQVGMVKILLATEGIDIHIQGQGYDNKTAQQIAIDNVAKRCEADAESQDCRAAQEIAAMFE